MEESLIKLSEYIIPNEVVDKCIKENREIQKEDVEIEIQEFLREKGIECKTKISERWTGRPKMPKYQLVAEIYVYEKDYDAAKKLLDEK